MFKTKITRPFFVISPAGDLVKETLEITVGILNGVEDVVLLRKISKDGSTQILNWDFEELSKVYDCREIMLEAVTSFERMEAEFDELTTSNVFKLDTNRLQDNGGKIGLPKGSGPLQSPCSFVAVLGTAPRYRQSKP